MTAFMEQLWVTSAVCDADVKKALSLSYSLQRTYTNRKIAVIASYKLSEHLHEALAVGFDMVFYLNENLNTACMKLDDFAKSYALHALRAFSKCVFVSPSMLAVKNCDDIFQTEGFNDKGLLLLENDEDASVFLFRPSMDHFKSILQGLNLRSKEEAGYEFGNFLADWSKNQFKKSGSLDKKYNNVLTPGKVLLGFERDICFVNLKKYGDNVNKKSLGSIGILGELTGLHLEKILEENVLPLIQDGTESSQSLLNLPMNSKEPIAIVGMSCRYPGSNNLQEFWDLLFQGQDGTCKPPPFRWMREQSAKNPADARNSNAGFLKVPVDEFDAKFFGVSPKEALFLDPQHRLMHELLWEGLEDASIDPQTLRGTSGSVFFGSWTNYYKDILDFSGNSEFYRAYMGNSIGAAAARLSFLLGLTGPSIATESGCSSAMVALHLACKSLQYNETNLAMVGGVNLLLRPFDKDIMPMILSPDGHCKTFSEDANGFGRAEGCGVLVLKRLSSALKDGDNIWALIRGSAVSQEGISKSMGTPTVHCESLAMKDALNDARVHPGEVSYVEAHGTGTSVGDPMEIAAIAQAYSCSSRDHPLIIGSVKTNVGHTESCSGITGIMKVVMSMYYDTIPAHQNFTKLNPAINLEAVPAIIPMERMEWKKYPGRPRIAGVSSFGITGTDAHVIIQEPPEAPLKKIMGVGSNVERPLHILKITAKTKEALDLLLTSYKETLETSMDNLCDIAYSANTGRADFNYRAVIISEDKRDAALKISKQNYILGDVSNENMGKICFLFTGQGSQYHGMAKHLHESSPVFQMHFDYCETIMKKNYNICLKEVLWGNGDKINQTIYSQTSIFCVQYALLKLWESWGVKPDFALGHSLGEFAAAVCAGIISVDDAIKLVAERSKLIDDQPHGKMLVVKADFNQLENLMKTFAGNDTKRFLDCAAINSSSQTVVAGDSDIVMEFSNFCAGKNIKFVALSASHAFHSRHMDPMLQKYRTISNTINAQGSKPTCQYISGMKGDIVCGNEVNAEYWVEHAREKVNFLDASKKAVELGCQTFIEIGPQPVLSALTMMNNDVGLLCLPSLKRKENPWDTSLSSLGKLYANGVNIDWQGIDQFYNRKKVQLPHYPFIGKKCWPDLMQTSGTTIHDLIGSPIPNASSTKIFQNGINLRSHEYIKDHAIGQHVVFPGAGYLEMCLAAGLATIENSADSVLKATQPMKIENLLIKAPLALSEDKTCQLQTVVEPSSGEVKSDLSNFLIKIFHREEVNTSKWLEHSSASFVPFPAAEDLITVFDIEEFKETIERPSNKDDIITGVYKKLDSVGLKFGPLFHSLEKLWENEQQNRKIWAKVKIPESGDKNYILHPVVIDAMIQAIMMFRVSTHQKVKLHVPIKIGNFIWLTNNLDTSGKMYVQVGDSHEKKTNTKTCSETVYLVNGDGNVLALMSGVEFIDTTAKAVEAVLEQQASPMPDMWEENWRPKLGPSQHRHDMELICKEICFDENFIENLQEKYNKIRPDMERTLETIDRLVYLNYLCCLYELGWKPELDSVFSEDEMLTQLGINSDFAKLLHYMLSVLEVEGILINAGSVEWKVVTIPQSLRKIKGQIRIELERVNFRSVLLLTKLGEEYSKILKGTQSALSILFPDEVAEKDRSWPSVAEFYLDYGNYLQIIDVFRDVTIKGVNHLKAHSKSEKNILRVLEVGAGTGMSAKPFIEILEAIGLQYEYTFTDISAGFFTAAEKLFEPQLKKMIFKKLNIEIDPISQGFVPCYYDYIIAGDVIHATRNITESLTNVKMLLRTGGQLIVIEQTKVSRFLTSIFGLLDGFWRFEDVVLRPTHCTISIDKWHEVLKKTGFTNINVFSTCQDSHSLIHANKNDHQSGMLTKKCTFDTKVTKMNSWIIFYQDESLVSKYLRERMSLLNNRNVIAVRAGREFKMSKFGNDWEGTIDLNSEKTFHKLFEFIESKEGNVLEGVLYCWSLDRENTVQEKVLRPFFYMVQKLLGMQKLASLRIIVLMDGIFPVEDNVSSHCYPSTIIGFVKSLQSERTNFLCRCIDVGGKEDEIGIEQVFYEIWNTDKESQVCYQNTSRYIAKIQPVKLALTDLKLPRGSNRFQLILPESKSISDLQFGPLESFALEEGEIEVHVKASALNFKDVLNVLKPSDDFKFSNSVGFDFAGIVKRVGRGVSKYQIGQHVFGLNINGNALPSHVKMDENDVFPVPEGMTLCDACTLPAVIATSYHCLVEVAKVTAADTVLIHAASGGVGLSAISICKKIGCTIIVTAGSKRKQSYLRSLGIDHVFHSRNHEYSEQILRATRGRGVDVVLNSLTSEGFKEATLKACGIGARFVEIGKLMIWKPEEVKLLRPDVLYTIVDLSSMKKLEFQRLFCAVAGLIENKYVSPIPYVRFDAVHIREALHYLQKAKHIGKVVCVMPQVMQSNGNTEVYTPMFNENSTYLITGGLGGVGFVVCKWMIEKGANHIILAGRSAPTELIQDSIREINETNGTNVIAVQLDVSDFQQCKELIHEKIPKLMGCLRPLRGIMHAAGTLKDSLIEDHTWSTLSSTFDSKVKGTLNLHELTKNIKLEHFVLFSSLASLFGPPGQCNHSAGNNFEDIMAHYRISIGLPATSINWGQWGEAGIATEIVLPGIKPLSNLQGTKGLEYALKANQAQIGCINIESFALMSKMYPQLVSFFDSRILKSLTTGASPGVAYQAKSDDFWQQYDSLQRIEDKSNLVRDKLRDILTAVLKLDETDVIEDNTNFQDMGVDSLMFVEIKNAVQTLFGNRVVVNANLMRDLGTMGQLADAMMQSIEGINLKKNIVLEKDNSAGIFIEGVE